MAERFIITRRAALKVLPALAVTTTGPALSVASSPSLKDKLELIRTIEARISSELDFEEQAEFPTWEGLTAELGRGVEIETLDDARALIDYAIEETDCVDASELSPLLRAVSSWMAAQAV